MATRGKLGPKLTKGKEARPPRWKKYKHLILIVCEDENTEPYYFGTFINKFPEETVFLTAVGTGTNFVGVVEEAIQNRSQLARESRKTVDETWVVFDTDNALSSAGNKQRFLDAFALASSNGIGVAYSNEVFELWLLLHLMNVDINQSIPRKCIYNLLENSIRAYTGYENFIYAHGSSDVVDIISEIGNETLAIQYAKKLDEYHNQQKNQPIYSNPKTLVYKLVSQLQNLIQWYTV